MGVPERGRLHVQVDSTRADRADHTSREISYGDLSGNGREDLVMVNGSGGGQTVEDNNYVWWNQITTANHWIEIKARSAAIHSGRSGWAPRSPSTARVPTRSSATRRLRTDFGYRSRRDAVLHFGLANVHSVDIRVQGAGLGSPVTVHNPRVDRAVTITMPPRAPVTARRTRTGRRVRSPGRHSAATPVSRTRSSSGNAGGPWRTRASRLNAPGYTFTSRHPEGKGTWRYRVTATYDGVQSNPSPAFPAHRGRARRPVGAGRAGRGRVQVAARTGAHAAGLGGSLASRHHLEVALQEHGRYFGRGAQLPFQHLPAEIANAPHGGGLIPGAIANARGPSRPWSSGRRRELARIPRTPGGRANRANARLAFAHRRFRHARRTATQFPQLRGGELALAPPGPRDTSATRPPVASAAATGSPTSASPGTAAPPPGR